MAHHPSVNTPYSLGVSYVSPRPFKHSYKSSSGTVQFSRDSMSFYRRSGDSTARDNWILGKGSTADGWDGWSLVQAEQRYWASKLSKPEFRGKCGGAAANRLSEEKIVKHLQRNNLPELGTPKGKTKSEALRDAQQEKLSSLADNLFNEYFPELAAKSPRAQQKAHPPQIHLPPSPSTPRR